MAIQSLVPEVLAIIPFLTRAKAKAPTSVFQRKLHCFSSFILIIKISLTTSSGYSCSTYISYATPTAHGVSQVSRGAAIAIEIRWKDSDLPLFGDNPPVVPVSLTGVSSTSTVLSTSPNAKTSTSTDVGQINTHQGRSTSTKAAIALGVILFFVLAVSILGFFYFLRYRKHIRDQASVLHPHEPDRPAGPVPEMVHQSGLLTGTDRHVQISKTEPEVEPVPESEISENPDLDALSDQRTGGTASERALELGSVSWSTKRKPLSQSSSARPK